MLYILAVVLPPLAVVLAGKPQKFLTSLILTILFWVPGIIHAWIAINRANGERRDHRLLKAQRKENDRVIKAMQQPR